MKERWGGGQDGEEEREGERMRDKERRRDCEKQRALELAPKPMFKTASMVGNEKFALVFWQIVLGTL